jgi:pyruvyl transferase EpsI
MIFSAITNTPCIAINNSNKKVAGVYNAWLKDFQSIKVVENFSVNEAMKLIKELTSKGSITTSKLVSNDEFNDLLKLLKE